MNNMRSRIMLLLIASVFLLLSACGSKSKEDVLKKLSGKWNDTKGYELQATMEIKTGTEPRSYDVTVWHTKPEFYKVNVTQAGSDDSQMIVRNEEGVFVVTPSLGKTYKFQSDWPAQNSQGYLIGTLSEDIKEDAESTMVEEDKQYIFETVTRNNHKKVLPTQKIYIDKKTLLPTSVAIFDDNKEEKIRITFNQITLGAARKADEYDVKMKETNETTEDDEDGEDEEKEEQSEQSEPETFIPTIEWEGTKLIGEEEIKVDGGKRILLSYGGEKEFTIIQEPAPEVNNQLTVSVEGDPVDLGFTVAALTEHSIRWEQEGVSFFVASQTLTQEELTEIAQSMRPIEAK